MTVPCLHLPAFCWEWRTPAFRATLGILQPFAAFWAPTPFNTVPRWGEAGFLQSSLCTGVGRSLSGLAFSILGRWGGKQRGMKSRWMAAFFPSSSSCSSTSPPQRHWPDQKPIFFSAFPGSFLRCEGQD
jgi:hypothetical protein